MSSPPADPALTLFLRNPHATGEGLAAAAMPVVYRELRQIAAAHLRRAKGPRDLQTTTLVHEVYVKLLGKHGAAVNDREHFFALAARAMRQVCVDHARARRAGKRGGDQTAVTLDEAVAHAANLNVDLLDLDAALSELAELDPREARVVELRFFGGMEMAEIAIALDVSLATVEREWRSARAWLGRRLGADRCHGDDPVGAPHDPS